MTIVDVAVATHRGRVRRTNEDSYLVEPPLFVVADGMGGANAGEIASGIVIETFAAASPLIGEPEEALADTIGLANERIWARARRDTQTSGMGTTATAAVVLETSIAFGHVGDSRVYLLRDGVLRQLSEDHSLVGELVRRGALTPEEAEVHPQRSVITRALGTEAIVDVDTFSIATESGDVYLLCSDGLSNMLADEDLQPLLEQSPTLAAAASALVARANRAGGEDNITVVLFRIGAEGDPPATGELTAGGSRTPAVEGIAGDAPTLPVGAAPAPGARRGSAFSRRGLAVGIVLVALVVGALAAGLAGLRYAHFVGSDHRRVAVFQGIPYTVGVKLYRVVYVSDVDVATLDQATRTRLFDHRIVSNEEAQGEVRSLQAAQPWLADPQGTAIAPTAASTTAPAASPPTATTPSTTTGRAKGKGTSSRTKTTPSSSRTKTTRASSEAKTASTSGP